MLHIITFCVSANNTIVADCVQYKVFLFLANDRFGKHRDVILL